MSSIWMWAIAGLIESAVLMAGAGLALWLIWRAKSQEPERLSGAE